MMASASLPVTPPHQIQFPPGPPPPPPPLPLVPLSIIRPSVIVNSLDNYKVETSTSQVINSRTNYHTNNQLLHDHNYAALPPTSTAAYFGIKPIRQKNSSQCGAAVVVNTSACCSNSSSTNCLGILKTTLTSPSPTSTKFQLNLQLNVLKCEIERLNEKCVKQQSQLEKLSEENNLKGMQLSEHLERIYVQENRLEEKQGKLEEKIIEKTELQDKFNRFKESVTKLSCGVILLIGELKRDYFNGGEDKEGVKVKRNGIANGRKEGEKDNGEDDKCKLGRELDKISELVKDNLRAWVFVDQVIEEEEVRMMRESLRRNRRGRGEKGEEEGDGEGKEVQVVQEVEVVEEEKENLSLVGGGDGEENEGECNDKWGPEEEDKEEMEVLDDRMEEEEEKASVGGDSEAVDESGKECDLKEVSEMSSQQSQDEERCPAPVSKVQKEPVKFFRCSMCPSLSMRFEEMAVMKVHLREVHQNKQWKNGRGCKRCGMVFVGIGQLHRHRLTEHSKSQVTKKRRKVKGDIVQEEAHEQGSSKMNGTCSEIAESPTTSTSPSPTPPVKLSHESKPGSSYQQANSIPDCKQIKIIVSDIMLGGERKKDKDKTSDKTNERKTRRSSSRSRSSSPSPPPPVLRKMTKSKRTGSNNSLASSISTMSEISHDEASTPPILDLEVGYELEQEKAEEKGEPLVSLSQPLPSSPIPSPPASEVQASIPPPSPPSLSLPPPTEKQEDKAEKKVGHATDLDRRHLGVYCICGKQFPRQFSLDVHIRWKTNPLNSGVRRRHSSSNSSTTKRRKRPVYQEKPVREKIVRTKPVKKEIPCASTTTKSFSIRTRRSSIIAGGASVSAAAIKTEVEAPTSTPIPSTSASALASSSVSIPIPTTETVTTVTVKPKIKRKKITHGLHPSKRLHCKCGFKAPLITFVKRHIKFHKPDRKFSCQICHRIYVSVRHLSHHYNTCHKVSQTNELITARGQVGKLMNCYVKIIKLDGDGLSQKNKSSDKTEDDDMSPRQLPWRPIFKKKLKKLRFTKRKERFICPWCQRHFPFYRKLARHLALNMHSGCGSGSDMGAGTSVGGVAGGGGGGGALKKMLFGCKPCEKIFYNQVEFLRHKAVFHRCSSSLTKFITVQKEINASIAAAAAADLSSSDGIKTRRALRRSSKSSSFSLSSSTKAVASTSTSAQATRSRLGLPSTKSARKRSFVFKTQRRRSLSSSPSRNSKCLCSASDSTSPCNGAGKRGGKKNFRCSKCKRVFTCPAYLKMHMGEKHNINCVIPKPCQRCGKVFPTASQLKKHAQVAHNKIRKPVKRQLRQETTPPQSPSRKQVASRSPPGSPPGSPVGPHRRMTGGGSRFKCVCGSLFSTKKLLFQHMQEKNQAKGKFFRCTLCPKQYTGSVHLKIHMLRTHNVRSVTSKSKKKGEDIFCQFCGMIFETQRKRIWHESRSHGPKKKVK